MKKPKMFWRNVREPFSSGRTVPRAVALRGGESDLFMLTLAGANRHGYAFQGARRIGFGHDADVTLRVSPQFLGTTTGCHDGRVTTDAPTFDRNLYGPDIVERWIDYPVSGLRVEESCLRTLDADYAWQSTWTRDAYRPHQPYLNDSGKIPLQIHLLLELRERSTLSWTPAPGGGLALTLVSGKPGDPVLHLALRAEEARFDIVLGDESCLRRMKSDLSGLEASAALRTAGAETFPPASEKVTDAVILAVRWSLPRRAVRTVRVGWSPVSQERALALLTPEGCDKAAAAVEADWNRFFARHEVPVAPAGGRSLKEQLAGRASRETPASYLDSDGAACPQAVRILASDFRDLTDADYQLAYAKCLALTRLCERVDPTWGPTLTETFTCFYTGTFAWSAPVAGWYARRSVDPRYRDMMRAVWDVYRQTQGLDGSLPCYIPFGQSRSDPPATHHVTQIPQYAWGVWQEFLHNGDEAWLRSWYEPLRRYADCMARREREHLNLGLWCQRHYYDGIDMFPTVDGLVIRKEPFLYSAVYAAEQVRFLDVLARIAARVSPGEAAGWAKARDAARKAMDAHLWDRDRQWYGDILPDGTRETVVGIEGLFACAYGLLPEDHDPAAVRAHLESLITPFGVATVAPSDRRYTERFFWRGPVWPASCLYGAGAARRYAPDLLPRIAAATVRFALAQPNIFECLEPHSGQVARYDEGSSVMPGPSSVVGAFAICAALDLCAMADLFSLEQDPAKPPEGAATK